MEGWVKFHRKSYDNFLYRENRPHTRREAWEDIIAYVNHEDKSCLIGNEKFECYRGQSLLSLESWGKIFNWDKSKVKRFFDLLSKENMIVIENLRKSTRLTVCKYDDYQSTRNADETQTKRKRNADETQTKPTKEGKELKNENNYKKMLLSELSASDVDQKHIEFLEMAKAFYELFKINLQEAGAPLTTIEKAKGTWVDDIRLMFEVDKCTKDDLRSVFTFLKTDNFWKKNILSASTLREKMPKLKLQIHNNNGKTKSSTKEGCTWDQLAEIAESAARKIAS